jgi:AcrR family transcriptional regulator
MVAYYFNDKAGLLEAVVRDMLAVLLGIVEEAVNSHPPGAFIPHLIRTYTGGISRAPWIPQILIREVISKDTPLRVLFVDEFASHALRLVPGKVVAEMEQGRLRSDLDPRFSILSLVGMCLFPFIAHPVLGPLLNYQLDPEFGEVYAEHAVNLFLRGAGAEPEAGA